jgi:Cdc6-like AAA superfamily ATPase
MRPYVSNELMEIARQRYEASCRPNSVSDEVLNKIGIFAEESGGDARMAIELLDRAIGEAEKEGRETVTEDDVIPSRSRSASVEPNQVDGLKLHQKLVLLGICRRLKRDEEISSGDASKLYELVCEENNETPKGYTTFWKYLRHLESEGLIVSRSSSSNRGRGRTRYITMPNSVPAVIGSRIENELLRR